MNSNLIPRLEKRKYDIIVTMEHIREQQLEVERSAEWMDLNARQRRRAFLAELLQWYDGKLKQIESVIERMTQPDRFAWTKREPGAPPPQAQCHKETVRAKSGLYKRN